MAQALRPLGHHRPRAPRRLAGGGDGERPDVLRRRLDGRRLPEGRRASSTWPQTFHLPVVYLVRLPRLPDRARGREERRHQAGRARHVGDVADDGAVVRGHHPQRLRRGGRGAPERRRAATGATPGRRAAGARCRSRAASRRPIAPTSTPRPIPRPRWREIEERLNKLRSPFRSRRDLLDRGDHRPARHAAAPLRVRRAGGARARQRARAATGCGLSLGARASGPLIVVHLPDAPASVAGGSGSMMP